MDKCPEIPAFPLTGSMVDAFSEIAKLQRGAAESAMYYAQELNASGVLSEAIEHAGDIIHRMNERLVFSYTENPIPPTYNKIEIVLRRLGLRYDWYLGSDFQAKVSDDVKYNAKRMGIGFAQLWGELKNRLKAYRDEHAKLPTYTRGQQVAQQVCVALGEMRWEDAVDGLVEMKHYFDCGDKAWKYFCWGMPKRVSNASHPKSLLGASRSKRH